ncbi:MAG: ABC transporter permease [Actinomycetota bacterium]|nr:ABC transporter permease [Actinomycetota bacterium]
MIKNNVLKFLKSDISRVLISIVVIVIAMTIFTDKFASFSNISSILRNQSIYGIMAIGVLMIILTGGIDLSIGSVYGFAGTVCAVCIMNGLHPFLVIIITVISGGIIGLLNGVIIAKVGVAPFIVTLGMLGIVRGLNYILTGATAIIINNKAFTFLGDGSLGKIPVPLIILIVIILIFNTILNNTIFGRRIYAIGGDEGAAVLTGINVVKMKILVYALAGSLYSIGGIIGAAKVASSYPLAGTGYEFEVIAACIIGGTLLSGGKGTVVGTVLGAIFIGILKNSIIILGISRFWQQAANGLIIIFVIAITSYFSKERESFC